MHLKVKMDRHFLLRVKDDVNIMIVSGSISWHRKGSYMAFCLCLLYPKSKSRLFQAALLHVLAYIRSVYGDDRKYSSHLCVLLLCAHLLHFLQDLLGLVNIAFRSELFGLGQELSDFFVQLMDLLCLKFSTKTLDILCLHRPEGQEWKPGLS